MKKKLFSFAAEYEEYIYSIRVSQPYRRGRQPGHCKAVKTDILYMVDNVAIVHGVGLMY